MKNIKKDIPSIIGLVAAASLTLVTGGVVAGGVNGLTALGSDIAANFFAGFTPAKMKKWFINTHPNDLNHNIKRLFIASIKEALGNISVLFSETQVLAKEKKEAKQFIKKLQKYLPKILLNSDQIKLEEPEIKHFLYEKEKEEMICNFIENQFAEYGITEPFKSFLAQNLPAQIQLCFGEGLKDPANQSAWIAFQRMLIEEIRNDIKKIADTQQNIKNDLSDLKFEKSGFSQEQIAEIHELIKILNNKELVEVKIRNGVNQSLKSVESKANEIIRITTKTQLTVDELKTIIEKIKQQNRTNQIIIYTLSLCLLVAGGFFAYRLMRQPFTATIRIVDWKGEPNDDIYNKGGCLYFDNGKYYSDLTKIGVCKFPELPHSYNKKSVRIHYKPEEQYQFMKLDTTIVVRKGETCDLKMYFVGIDKITRCVIDQTGKPVPNAYVEIDGEDTYTDDNGKFTIKLPLEKQKRFQKLMIKKDGFSDYINNSMDMTSNNEYIKWELKKE